MPPKRCYGALCILAAAAALSARGKLKDASRTQRLRNADRSSVLGMAAAALALATAEDDGEDDARAQIAELAAAAAQNVAVDATLAQALTELLEPFVRRELFGWRRHIGRALGERAPWNVAMLAGLRRAHGVLHRVQRGSRLERAAAHSVRWSMIMIKIKSKSGSKS